MAMRDAFSERYTRSTQLGSGAFAKVYKAFRNSGNDGEDGDGAVAVKVRRQLPNLCPCALRSL